MAQGWTFLHFHIYVCAFLLFAFHPVDPCFVVRFEKPERKLIQFNNSYENKTLFTMHRNSFDPSQSCYCFKFQVTTKLQHSFKNEAIQNPATPIG